MTTVAVIGTGFGSKVQVPGWKKIPGAVVTNIPGHDWKKAISDPKITIISIATPPFTHTEITLAALKNKKTVLLEKPAGINLIEVKKIAEAAKKNSTLVAIDFELRFIPHFQFLKDLLTKKAIGNLRAISITWITGGRAGTKIIPGWSNYNKTGGGVLLNYGSHIIDYVNWLFGDFTNVFGTLHITKKSNGLKPISDADDTVSILGTLKNKVPVNITISNVCHNGSGHTIEIYGSTGTIILKNPNVFDVVKGFALYKTDSNGELNLVKIPSNYGKLPSGSADGRIKPFQTLASELMNVVKNKNRVKTVLPTITDAVKVHRAISAILKSNRSKKWEKV